MNLWRLSHRNSLLVGEGTGDNKLANIIFLGEIEQFPDVVGSFRSQSAGNGAIGQSLDGFTGLRHDQVQDRNIVTDNATTDGFPFAFTLSTGPVGLVSLLTQQTDAVIAEDTLSHGETLFVIATTDTENVSVEFFSQDTPVHFLGHAAVVEILEPAFVVNLENLLFPGAGTSDVDLWLYISGEANKAKRKQGDDECRRTFGKPQNQQSTEKEGAIVSLWK